jgi:pimeloyl-ACP methyl ester carboxylesterase
MTNRLLLLTLLLVAPLFLAEDGDQLLSVDHYVRVKSTVPSIAGQISQIYVRERARAATPLRSANLADRVVLFVHGAGTPAEVAFDVPYQDYSWMAYLARAGFDVFSMDTTGYGRSTRPPAMNDPCNLSQEQQKTFAPGFLSTPCAPSYSRNVTTLGVRFRNAEATLRPTLEWCMNTGRIPTGLRRAA